MHSILNNTLFAFVALGLCAAPLSAAPKSHVKEKGQLTLTAALTATVNAPVGASGTAEIAVTKEKFKSVAVAQLTLSTTGLAAGTYSVDANLKDLTVVHLGDFIVDATVPPTGTDEPLVIAIPATLDSSNIASLSVSDSTAVVMLQGDVVAGTVTAWKYIANVRVTAPETTTETKGHGKRVRGHVVLHSFITNNVEEERHVVFIGFGAPKSTELTINVDGVAVGTVLSTDNGKVMFHELAETVIIRDVKLITITDALGVALMQAAF